MMSRLFALRGMLVASFAMMIGPLHAEEKFPSHPIELILPTVPGGGVDASFRILADLTEPYLGQKITVINKPGASGTLGTSLVTQAKPDGYTIGGIWNAPLTMVPHILDVAYTPKDYVSVGMVTTAPMIMCAKKEFPANNGKELIDLIRKNPDKFTYGTDGVGGIVHLSFARIFNKLGVRARAIPYKGASETLAAFMGDHIDLYGGTIALIEPHVKNGTVKCLLVTSAERNAVATDASSLADLGIPGEATANWRGVIAPKGVPADRLAVLEKAFQRAASSEQFKKKMQANGDEAQALPPAEMQKRLDSEYAAFGQIVRAVGLAKKP